MEIFNTIAESSFFDHPVVVALGYIGVFWGIMMLITLVLMVALTVLSKEYRTEFLGDFRGNGLEVTILWGIIFVIAWPLTLVFLHKVMREISTRDDPADANVNQTAV